MAYAYGLYLWHAYGHGRPPHPRPARLLGAALSQRGEASPRRVHAWCIPSACLVYAWCMPGVCLVHAWCIPSVCLVYAWCMPGVYLVYT